jgi:ectoine hydroxylase-related dioxygenase (phytanoyl-CoA dioxygenase family)
VHELSPLLTLQGGIAHCDIPIDSGPTKVLPFSQQYKPGYTAWRRDDFRDYFENHFVQLPLHKGDAMFFNPALFHAAGSNSTKDNHRMLNLLQISSAFGRAMETINRQAMCNAIYDALAEMYQSGELDDLQLNAVAAATAEGYSFPTNLDFDPPVGGLAPKTQRVLLEESIKANLNQQDFNLLLQQQLQRQRAD